MTHDQAEALSLADQVAVMRGGRLAQVGSPTEVYGNPVDSETATFLGEAILLPATVHNGMADCALGLVPVAESTVEGPARLLLRPEQLRLTADGVPARIREISYYGHDAAVRLDLLPAGTPVTARVAGHELTTAAGEVRLMVIGTGLAYPS